MRLRKSTPTDDSGFVAIPSQSAKPGGRGRKAAPEAPVAAPAAVRPDGWQPLGELLMARKAVSSTQVSEALLQQGASGKRVGNLLVELGAIDERELAEVLGEQLDVAAVR